MSHAAQEDTDRTDAPERRNAVEMKRTLSACFETSPAILMEGALGERLKREYALAFDEHVAMANLVNEERGAAALSRLWGEYIDIARRHGLPFLATTPTRRANRERMARSSCPERLFEDNVTFLRRIADESGIEMYVGGLMGCRGDAYTGEGALTQAQAAAFHRWTAERFLRAGVDFLYAGIMPTLPEAAGLAEAIDGTGLPYIISFTIRRDGCLIDGTPIADAIACIDARTANRPLCYMTNCVHPSILYEALSRSMNDRPVVRERFRGIQANTSPLPYAQLDGAVDLHCSEPEAFARGMLRLREIADIRIWGGCCGTDSRHMECVARRLDARGRGV